MNIIIYLAYSVLPQVFFFPFVRPVLQSLFVLLPNRSQPPGGILHNAGPLVLCCTGGHKGPAHILGASDHGGEHRLPKEWGDHIILSIFVFVYVKLDINLWIGGPTAGGRIFYFFLSLYVRFKKKKNKKIILLQVKDFNALGQIFSAAGKECFGEKVTGLTWYASVSDVSAPDPCCPAAGQSDGMACAKL